MSPYTHSQIYSLAKYLSSGLPAFSADPGHVELVSQHCMNANWKWFTYYRFVHKLELVSIILMVIFDLGFQTNHLENLFRFVASFPILHEANSSFSTESYFGHMRPSRWIFGDHLVFSNFHFFKNSSLQQYSFTLPLICQNPSRDIFALFWMLLSLIFLSFVGECWESNSTSLSIRFHTSAWSYQASNVNTRKGTCPRLVSI